MKIKEKLSLGQVRRHYFRWSYKSKKNSVVVKWGDDLLCFVLFLSTNTIKIYWTNIARTMMVYWTTCVNYITAIILTPRRPLWLFSPSSCSVCWCTVPRSGWQRSTLGFWLVPSRQSPTSSSSCTPATTTCALWRWRCLNSYSGYRDCVIRRWTPSPPSSLTPSTCRSVLPVDTVRLCVLVMLLVSDRSNLVLDFVSSVKGIGSFRPVQCTPSVVNDIGH